MRWLAVAVTVLACSSARAERIGASAATPDLDRGNFWREITEPHHDQIAQILIKAQAALTQADASLAADYDPGGAGRLRLYSAVYGMLRYARRLAPENVEVLKLLARTSDGLGKTSQALEALHRVIDLVGADRAGYEVTGELGEIYLRLGQVDDAIRYLRLAQGPIIPGQPATARVLVHLATALAARGQISDGIDVLANSLPSTNVPYYASELQLVMFALAVQYDRDEQRGAAFEVLQRLETALQSEVGPLMLAALSTLRFAPADDQQYYRALLYEMIGHYPEARAEWTLYAAVADRPYRRRALDHVAALDAIRRTEAVKPTQQPLVPPPAAPSGGSIP